jgi:nitrous oxide reductase accessory protein NosL
LPCACRSLPTGGIESPVWFCMIISTFTFFRDPENFKDGCLPMIQQCALSEHWWNAPRINWLLVFAAHHLFRFLCK